MSARQAQQARQARFRDEAFDRRWSLPENWLDLPMREVEAILRRDKRTKQVRKLVAKNRRKRLGRRYAQKYRQRAKDRVDHLETLVRELKPSWKGFDEYVDSVTKAA